MDGCEFIFCPCSDLLASCAQESAWSGLAADGQAVAWDTAQTEQDIHEQVSNRYPNLPDPVLSGVVADIRVSGGADESASIPIRV